MNIKKTVSYLLAITILLGSMLSLSACSDGIKSNELSKNYTRQVSENVQTDADFEKVMSDFSVKLLQNVLNKPQGNDIISPLSAIECLSMIANGTEGNSRKQIEETLGVSMDDINKLIYKFNSHTKDTSASVKIANSLWIRQNSYKIKQSFLQTNADWYGAQIYEADFNDHQTVKDINNWVKNNTDKMIDKIIEEIPYDTFMYLINALTFDSEWATKYEKDDIITNKFTSYNGSTTDVEMMFSDEGYLECGNAQGFRKQYKDDKYSFVGILPNEGVDIFDYIASLDGNTLLSILNTKTTRTTRVGIPEFDFEYEIELNNSLKSMGISDIFDDKAANFSSMAESADNIYCGYIKQKVKIEVNRKGTKAAAVTWGEMKNGSMEPDEILILDRPFMYMILDNQNNIPLFIGIVTNPNSDGQAFVKKSSDSTQKEKTDLIVTEVSDKVLIAAVVGKDEKMLQNELYSIPNMFEPTSQIAVGDKLTVVHNGLIRETYPMQFGKIFEISYMDSNGYSHAVIID